jgi:Galactosyltransferase.
MFRFLASQVAGLIRSRKKLAVIIPYRDRDAHLKELLPELEDLLLRSSIDFSICVVEQANDLPFNKGILLNVGFLESSSCDYFCFHDVDMIPLRADYSYVRSPTHLASNVEQFVNAD